MDFRKQSIVVTGSSGAGKSTVCELLKGRGALVLSADEFSRQATAPGEPAVEAIRREFGERFVLNGVLERRALAELVFNDEGARKKLEAIVHPEVRRLADEQFARETLNTSWPLIIYDCPLFFEANLGRENFRGVVVVTAPEELRLARIIQRDGISIDEARARMKNQLPEDVKISQADLVVDNSGSVEELKKQVEEILWMAHG